MHFLAALVLPGLALLLQTAVAFPAGDNWIVLSTEETANGTLEFYSPRPLPPAPVLAERQLPSSCGNVQKTCGKTDQAKVSACNTLIDGFKKHSQDVVDVALRSICGTYDGDRCCVNWAKAVSGLTQGDLVDSALQLVKECKVIHETQTDWRTADPLKPYAVYYKAASGVARNVRLRDVCTTQCLSNRPDGCN